MFMKRGLWQVVMSNIVVAFLVFAPFLTTGVRGGEVSPVHIGEVMATGNAYLALDSGELVRIDRYPIPLLGRGNIKTGDGVAVIAVTPEGVVEIQKETAILLYRDGNRTVMNMEKGMVRFSVPSTNNLFIVTPSGRIEVGGPSRVVAKTGTPILNEGERAGIVGIEKDGKTLISSLKGDLRFTAQDGRGGFIKEGETIRLAQAEVGAPGPLKGITSSQLKALAAQEGMKVMVGVTEVPSLAAGEVALAIPAELGGGFIVGTPAAIASGLTAVGIVTTATAVSGAAVAAAAVGIGTGAMVAIGAGVVAAGVGIAAAMEEASPSQ